jgi:hypothetical protein
MSRTLEEMERNPDLWNRRLMPDLVQENLEELAVFLGASPNDIAFIESTIRGG